MTSVELVSCICAFALGEADFRTIGFVDQQIRRLDRIVPRLSEKRAKPRRVRELYDNGPVVVDSRRKPT